MGWRNGTSGRPSGRKGNPDAPPAPGIEDPDQLNDAEMAAVDRELDSGMEVESTVALAELVEPRPGLPGRMKIRADRRILGQKTALTCADLIGTAWRTVMQLFGPTRRP